MRGDGDGWTFSADGTKHWGRHGAAGLLLRAPLPDGRPAVLLQHRAIWSHQGGTWALPGGARDSHETAVHAAMREAEEEAGLDHRLLRVRAERVTARAPSGWTYTTVIADAAEPLATVRNRESAELRWVVEDDVERLKLHPAFRTAWTPLRTAPVRLHADGSADAEALTAALPRTIEIPGGGFGWLNNDIAGLTALIGDDVQDLAGNVFSITPAQVLS